MKEIFLVYKALADKNRLRILWALHHCGELCACRLVELLDISGSAVSQHLSVLSQAGLCSGCKEGRWIHYTLSSHPLLPDFTPLENDPTIKKDCKKLQKLSAFSDRDLCRIQREK